MSIKSIFDLAEFKQHKTAWNNRMNSLSTRASYYDGSVYSKAKQGLGWLAPRMFQGIRSLYLPLARAVDVDAGIIPGGWGLPKDEPKAELWQKAINTLFDWSAWDTDGVLFVHYGAQYGVSGLYIVDHREKNRVVIQPTDPTLFMLVGMGMYDENPDMSLFIEKRIDDNGDIFEYAEVTTNTKIRTFSNGSPMAFGKQQAEYENKLGFVPYVEVRHLETGKPLGESTGQKAIPMLDEVNEIASDLANVIKKNSDPQWSISGAEPSDLQHGANVVWFLPQGAEAKILVPGIDIDGTLAFIKEIAANVKESLPELAFDDLRRKDTIATATLELQLMELVLKIKRTRPNYDRGLTSALKLAGKAAKTMSLSEISVLDDPGLRFDSERPILPVNPEDVIRLRVAELELEQMENASITEGVNA